jgi:hypothetical protein
MSLSDIMSAAGLASYAEVGLILFLLVFVSIAVKTLARSKSDEWERARLMPLLADEPAAMSPATSSEVPRE